MSTLQNKIKEAAEADKKEAARAWVAMEKAREL